MSDLETSIKKRIKLNGVSAEYEEAFRSCKKLQKVLNNAIINKADEKTITKSIIEMQSSLEIVKICNNVNSSEIEKGVYDHFGIKKEVATAKKVMPKASSNTKKK